MNPLPLIRSGSISLISLMAPALLAGLVTWTLQCERAATHVQPSLVPFEADTAQGLTAILNGFTYSWPPQKNVPALELVHFPPGMAKLQPDVKTSTFLRALLPLAITINNQVRKDRKEILGLLDETRRTGHWPAHLQSLAARYEVDTDKPLKEVTKLLKRRCNVVPVSLILAQAAKESGWGSSQFALKANNLFGIHTWDPDAGIPASRSSTPQTNRVRSYPNLLASVRDYVHNLNVGHAYVKFRELRANQQADGHLDSTSLARTLGSYSQLGETYISQLQQLIAGNGLTHLHSAVLRPAIPQILSRPAP